MDEHGLVQQEVRAKGKFSITDMDLKMFPFDAQNLQIVIKSHRIQIKDLVLIPNRYESVDDGHQQHEWKNLTHCFKPFSTDPNTSSSKKVYS